MYSMDFEYAGKRLSDFGCTIGYIDKKPGVSEVNVGCDITFTEVKNNHSSMHYKTSSKHDSVYRTPQFEIIRKDYTECDYFTVSEARDIIKWLNRKDYYRFKPIYSDYDTSNIHYYGSFNVSEIFLKDKIIGFSVVFTSNSPFAYDGRVENRYMMLNPVDEISIFGDSDEYGIIYPKLEIKCFADGDLQIVNKTMDKTLEINNCVNGEIIKIDAEHKILLTSNEEHEETIANDFNYEYLGIQAEEDYEENIYYSTLPCEMTIIYYPIRKIALM